MANILTIFLLISTLITGMFWAFYRIKNFKNYLINKKTIKNDYINKINSKNRIIFFESLSSLFPIFLIIFTIRSFFYEPFQIPSGSMMPTLLVGDFILVEKFSYGIKEPITNTTLIHTSYPKRGDVVVFKHPNDYNVNYIKRIVGLPGDKIKYNIKNKHIEICANYLNKKNCQEKLFIHYSKSQLSDFIQKIYFFNKNDSIKEKKIYNSLYFNILEENINSIKHNILILKNIKNIQNPKKDYYRQEKMPHFTWIIPEGQYFMMGDNRDNSLDSRYWGFVPEKNLIGKAVKIWMSFNKNEDEWPTGIRINRIGNIC